MLLCTIQQDLYCSNDFVIFRTSSAQVENIINKKSCESQCAEKVFYSRSCNSSNRGSINILEEKTWRTTARTARSQPAPTPSSRPAPTSTLQTRTRTPLPSLTRVHKPLATLGDAWSSASFRTLSSSNRSQTTHLKVKPANTNSCLV